MRFFFVCAFATILLTANACEQKDPQNQLSKITQNYVDAPSPFFTGEEGGHFFIGAEIESDLLFEKYNPIFSEHGYAGNGYSWEGHIEQILEKLDKELLAHLEFDSEMATFYARADSKETQQRFVNILSPIFADLSQLEAYLRKADRGRISD